MKYFQLPNEEKDSVLRTVRIRISLLKRIEELSASSGLSVNKIINESILYALDHFKETDKKDKKSSLTESIQK